MAFNFEDFDLNQPAPYDGESVATADRLSSSSSDVIWNMEGHHPTPQPSRSDALPLLPPPPQHATPPQPPTPQAPPLSLELTLAPPLPLHQRQAHGQRLRQSDSLGLNSPAPQRRRGSNPNQPRPPSEARHEVPSEGSSNMEGHPCPFQFTLLQPSGSGAPPPLPTSAVPSSSTLKLNMTAGTNSSNGFQVVKAFLKDAPASTVFSIQLLKDTDDQIDDE